MVEYANQENYEDFAPTQLRKGAAYIRYSSRMQEESLSLDAQIRQIKTLAQVDGVEIVQIYTDEASSAYKNKLRPGSAQMLEDGKQQKFSIVYVYKLDRLSRRLEWSIEVINKLIRYGIEFKTVEQKFDLSTPEEKFMFHILGSLGELYSDNLSRETHKSKYERAKHGYHNGWTSWGYVSQKIGDHQLAIPDPFG